jgi:hypothetical protein
MDESRTDFVAILEVLAAHEVDFVIVGGVCGVLHGAPLATFDLDLVHSRAPENVERLLAALGSLEAHVRGRGPERIRPDRSHLSSPGHQLLLTKWGPLDLLGEIGAGRGYPELLAHTVGIQVGPGLKVRVLDLDTLIRTKEEADRPKDRAVLDLLRRTRDERGEG